MNDDSEDSNGVAPQCPILPEWPEHVRDAKHISRLMGEMQIRVSDIHADTKHLETIAKTTKDVVDELRSLRRDNTTRVFSYGILAIILAMSAVVMHHSLEGTPMFKWSTALGSFESAGTGTAHAQSTVTSNGSDSRTGSPAVGDNRAPVGGK